MSKSRKIIILVILIMSVLGASIVNSFKGNPLSAAIADVAIKKYVEQKYPTLNLKVEKSKYIFKFHEYMGRAVSDTSKDTHFSVYYRNGEVVHDDYEGDVIEKFNTLRRLEDEYSQLVITILNEDELLKGNTSMVVYDDWEEQKVPLH